MFEIHFSKRAGKYIKKLDKPTKERIKRALLLLAENPYDTNLDIRRLAGYDDSFRLRIGNIEYYIKLWIMKS